MQLVLQLVLESLPVLVISSHRWDALVSFSLDRLRDRVDRELRVIDAIACTLCSPVAICAPVGSASIDGHLEELRLGCSWREYRGLLLVARIHDVSCAPGVAHVLAVILLGDQVIVAEVYLRAHILHRLFRPVPTALAANSKYLHVWVEVPMIEFLPRVSSHR